MKNTLLCLSLLLWVTPISPACADLITQWTFDSVPPDSSTSTGTNRPSFGNGTTSLIGGVTAKWAAGSTNDPASSTDDSAWNTSHYPGQGIGNKTAGVQFNVSTLGYSNIVIRWDQRVSDTASKYYRLQYSADGTTFTDFTSPVTLLSSGGTFEPETNSLAAILGVNNNANFAFRVVSEFESTA